MVKIGFNARLFPSDWRPATQEIEFAAANGFHALQLFIISGNPLNRDYLGADFALVRSLCAEKGINLTVESQSRIDDQGLTAQGLTPLGELQGLVPAIVALGVPHVHWHIVMTMTHHDEATVFALEDHLVPQLAQAVALGQQYGFAFSLEHNAQPYHIFPNAKRIKRVLEQVEGLGVVWDFNHTAPKDVPSFLDLAPYISLLHVSDSRLPQLNDHLPLGEGNIDLQGYCAALRERNFDGYAILEIGGQPQSGGYGQDTDDALRSSRALLADAFSRP